MPPSVPFHPDHVVVSDGGLATQLEADGHDLTDALWSARLLRDDPAAITAAHLAFLRAGAQIVTTADYQASFDGFAAAGLDRAEAGRLMVRAVDLARDAVDLHEAQTGQRALVAVSVGPYGAALADGSEYRGRYGLPVRALRDWHERRFDLLAAQVESGRGDLLAIETIPDVDEAEALVDLVRRSGVPAWLSYTVAGGRTRAGQPLDAAFAVATGIEDIVAVGVNCCPPTDVLSAVETAREVTGGPVVVYPNSGEGWDAQARVWTGTGVDILDLVADWVEAGARVVGGCCRVGPDRIAPLRRTTTTPS